MPISSRNGGGGVVQQGTRDPVSAGAASVIAGGLIRGGADNPRGWGAGGRRVLEIFREAWFFDSTRTPGGCAPRANHVQPPSPLLDTPR